MAVRGVLFDLWNTICFSDHSPNPMVLLAGAAGLGEGPGARKMLERAMMTRPLAGIEAGIEALEGLTGVRVLGEERRSLLAAWRAACAATRLYDDALPALAEARRSRRVGILSNTQSFDLGFIAAEGIGEAVDALCLSCDIGAVKPDRAAFDEAARRLGIPSGEILMVGDSAEDDVEGAVAAGMLAVHLDRRGAAGRVPGAAGTIRRLTEIAAFF